MSVAILSASDCFTGSFYGAVTSGRFVLGRFVGSNLGRLLIIIIVEKYPIWVFCFFGILDIFGYFIIVSILFL